MLSFALPWILAQADQIDDGSAGLLGGAMSLCCTGIALFLAVFVIAGMWKVFEKAGQPGWAAIVPIYNAVVLLQIARMPLWWLVLLFLPCVNAVAGIVIGLEVAKQFGKGAGYGLGLALLPMIFYPMLGFSDAKYHPAK